MDDSEPKSVHEMDISVNTKKVKYAKGEERAVTDIELIKVPGDLNYLSVLKSSLTTSTWRTNVHVWQV